jgi:hypothetical protein
MKIVSYYTINTPYEEVAKTHLIPSLEKWGLTNHIEQVNSLGNWKLNTDYKPTFLLQELEYEEEICWVDADATIEDYPILLDNIPPEYPIALHYLDWNKQYGYTDNKKECLSGTLILRKSSIPLIKEWIRLCKDFNWEQRALDQAIKNLGIVPFELPPEYCCVVTRDYKIPTYIPKPVIVHWQASRKYKKLRSI